MEEEEHKESVITKSLLVSEEVTDIRLEYATENLDAGNYGSFVIWLWINRDIFCQQGEHTQCSPGSHNTLKEQLRNLMEYAFIIYLYRH